MSLLTHIMCRGALRRLTKMRPLLMAIAADEPMAAAAGLRFCPTRPTGCCWLSTSAGVRAVHPPRPQPPEGGVESRPQSEPRGETVPEEVDPLQDKSIGLVQRFKRTFKQYWKVLIPVHIVTSCVWFGAFYYAAMKGINVVPFLEMIGLPESLVGLLRESSSGYALTAYGMYKIATPARYTVTLGGTSLSVQYLRKQGYLSTPPPVKDYIQDKMEETKEKLTEKMEETKEKLTEKMEETKDRFSEKMEETKERLSEKMEETKGRFSEKMEETKDKLSEKLQETKDRVRVKPSSGSKTRDTR